MIKMDKETKEMLKTISIISGISEGIVKEVWFKTVVYWLMEYSKKAEDDVKVLKIPFLGNVVVKNDKLVLKEKGTDLELDVFVSLNIYFKELLKKLKEIPEELFLELLEERLNNKMFVVEEILDDTI